MKVVKPALRASIQFKMNEMVLAESIGDSVKSDANDTKVLWSWGTGAVPGPEVSMGSGGNVSGMTFH